MLNPNYINLLLTAFQRAKTVCSGLLDWHKVVLNVLKTSAPNCNPRQTTYRHYKKSDSLKFNSELKSLMRSFGSFR